jgi:hypothetical protein
MRSIILCYDPQDAETPIWSKNLISAATGPEYRLAPSLNREPDDWLSVSRALEHVELLAPSYDLQVSFAFGKRADRDPIDQHPKQPEKAKPGHSATRSQRVEVLLVLSRRIWNVFMAEYGFRIVRVFCNRPRTTGWASQRNLTLRTPYERA